MQINLFHNTLFSYKSNDRNKCYITNSISKNLAPLSYDTVSFGAMKKNQFTGIDFAVVEKFKAPIEKFNSNEDLQDWAGNEVEKINLKDFGGRSEQTIEQRCQILDEWKNYIFEEDYNNTNTKALLILDAVTKNLKPNNYTLPPKFNENILNNCLSEVDFNLSKDRKYQFNFNNLYTRKLQSYFSQSPEHELASGWVIIPSQKNDPEHFESNVDKLKILSSKQWCTKGAFARPYLAGGDFHIYFDKGHPRIGLKFVDKKIDEIQSEDNKNNISICYVDELNEHINNNGYKMTFNTRQAYDSLVSLKSKIRKLKKSLAPAIEKNNVKMILNRIGINSVADENGLLTIDEYHQPANNYTFSDLGIDENKLFEKIKEIKGVANFENSNVTNLKNLELIGDTAYFSNSKVKDLGNLREIKGSADFSESRISSLSQLKIIGKNAKFENSKVETLNKLELIGGNANFNKSQVRDLGNLEHIKGSASFKNSRLTNLAELKTIGGNADFSDSQITDLGELTSIGQNAIFSNSKISSLKKLEFIGQDAMFINSQVVNLGDLKSLHTPYISCSKLTKEDFNNVQVEYFLF